MKYLIGIAVFLATFFFGIATAKLAERSGSEAAAPVGSPVVETREPAPEDSTPEDERQPSNGWYALDKFKGMDEVMLISIYDPGTLDDEAGGGVFTTLENYGDQGFFGSSWLKIDGNHVKFVTEKINGVRYQFEGTFRSANCSGREGEKPLYGTLQKFVKGKMIAEATGNFEYFEPHCWH
jgi:hypothetical protein